MRPAVSNLHAQPCNGAAIRAGHRGFRLNSGPFHVAGKLRRGIGVACMPRHDERVEHDERSATRRTRSRLDRDRARSPRLRHRSPRSRRAVDGGRRDRSPCGSRESGRRASSPLLFADRIGATSVVGEVARVTGSHEHWMHRHLVASSPSSLCRSACRRAASTRRPAPLAISTSNTIVGNPLARRGVTLYCWSVDDHCSCCGWARGARRRHPRRARRADAAAYRASASSPAFPPRSRRCEHAVAQRPQG